MSRVSVVLGERKTKYLQWYFEGISNGVEIQFCELSDTHPRIDSKYLISYFEPVVELSGYMRGLEDALKGADVIIGFLSQSVSAFQALSIAEKYNMKFILIVDCGASNYTKFDHFSTAQQLFSRSHLFLCYDSNFKELLEIEGVSFEKIHDLPLVINREESNKKANLAQYFIDGINNIVCNEPLENYNAICQLLVKFADFLKFSDDKSYLLNLIGEGSCENSRRISFFVHDLGLKDNVRLIEVNEYQTKKEIISNCSTFINISNISDIFCENHSLLMHAYKERKRIFSTEISNIYKLLEFIDIESFTLEGSHLIKIPSIPSSKMFLHDITMKLGKNCYDENMVKLFDTLHSTADFEAIIAKYQELKVDMDDSTKAKILVYLASSYYRMGELERAEQILRDSAQKYKLTEINNLLAKFLFMSHSFNDALGFYKDSISIHKDNLEATFGIACVYERTGLYEESLVWLGKCVFISKDPDRYITLYARICLELEDTLRAIYKIEQMISIVGEYDCLLFSLGKLYIKSGDSKKGRHYIERSNIVEINKAG